jgi:hypothetical protein
MSEIWEFESLDITEEEEEPIMVHLCVSVASAPSGTLGFFRTPSSATLASMGGKAGAKLGLVFVSEVLDVCGGVISGLVILEL